MSWIGVGLSVFAAAAPETGSAEINCFPQRRSILLVAIGWFCCGLLFHSFSAEILTGRVQARGLVTAVFPEHGFAPSMTIRAQSFYTDYERRGFFRIGMLPICVLEGVSLEIHDPGALTNAMRNVQRWAGTEVATRLELRNASVFFTGASSNRLVVGRATITPHEWRLGGGVRLQHGTNLVTAKSALLQLTGSAAGTLSLISEPPFTTNLLSWVVPPTLANRRNHHED